MLHIESLGTLHVFDFNHVFADLLPTAKGICTGDLEIDRRTPARLGQCTFDVIHVGYA